MSFINISNLIVGNSPASFLSPFHFSVTFECLQPIKDEIEWKVIYVGCPKDDTYDQVLDSFSVGPFTEAGVMQFDIEPPAPDYSKIPQDDLLGVAAIIHSVSYQKQEFFRVGYFVYNNYEDPELVENPYPLQLDKIVRSILADKPRIIRHNIDWESDSSEKLKALSHILMENSSIINTDNNNISFKGLFSDVDQQKTEENKLFGGDFNGFSWNSSLQTPLNNNGGMMSGTGLFGNNNNNQSYNQNPFTGFSNGGGMNMFGNNENYGGGYGDMDGGQRYGNGFMEGNHMQEGMNYHAMN